MWNQGGLGYVAAPIEWAFSPLTGALDLGSSYYRGRGGWITDFDRQKTDLGLFVVGGARSMATKAAGLSPAAETIAPKISKNSLSYVGDTHVYVIKGPGESIWKYGESAQGLNSGGFSLRGEMQARALRQNTGEFYRSEILQTLPAKAPARVIETQLLKDYVRIHGQLPPGNKVYR